MFQGGPAIVIGDLEQDRLDRGDLHAAPRPPCFDKPISCGAPPPALSNTGAGRNAHCNCRLAAFIVEGWYRNGCWADPLGMAGSRASNGAVSTYRVFVRDPRAGVPDRRQTHDETLPQRIRVTAELVVADEPRYQATMR